MSTQAKAKVTSKALRGFLDTSKAPSRVVGPIERHLMKRPLDTSRRQDVLHPSEIVKESWCVRAAYFKIDNVRQGNEHPYERHGLRLQSVFDVGHAAHAKWQGYLAEMNVLYGEWTCPRCGVDRTSDNSTCPVCGTLMVYKELGLVDEDLNISGSTDGWITTAPEAVLEIKTIGSGTIRAADPAILSAAEGNLEKAFDAIRRPFRDHRLQAQMYLYLLHDMHEKGIIDRTPPDEAVFLYECKANQAFKEFTVAYRRSQIEPVLELAADVNYALEIGRAPRCNHGGCDQCKEV